MKLSRRAFLEALGAAAATAALPAAVRAASDDRTLWRNWSGALHSTPRRRVAPRTEAELIEYLRSATGALRPVGAGHSFAPLVPTDGDLLVLDHLEGLGEIDTDDRRAWVGAGTHLYELGPLLAGVGQACPNMPDIDRQTLGGALATSTHGTGDFRSMSGYVSGLRLALPSGELRTTEAETDPELLQAAAVSLGALGVVTAARLDNVAPRKLRARNFPEKLETVLAEWDARVAAHRHFEFFPLPHCDWVFSLAIDEVDDDTPVHNPPPTPEEDAELYDALRMVAAAPVMARRTMFNGIVSTLEPTEAVDVDYGILCNIRNQRFNEMEYSVPADVGMACVREVMETIAEESIDVVFPIEVRYIAGDDAWLSMFEGGPRVSISIHDFAENDFRPYFDAIEPIFLKYGGRPHWGKVHTLGAGELAERWPRFDDFRRLRAELDPGGRLLNGHLRTVFGA